MNTIIMLYLLPSIIMACKINLRRDQSLKNLTVNPEVTIYAPSWVRLGLQKLGKELKGTTFHVIDHNHDHSSPPSKILQEFTLSDQLTLTELQKISRNEKVNTDGVLNKALYAPLINDTKVLYAMKDLVRQCVIVGRDLTTHYGGYPDWESRKSQIGSNTLVYICDLAGLQFQKEYNTGRLVLIQEDNDYKEGLLDSFIFENIVKEKRKSFQEVDTTENDTESGRYVKIQSCWKNQNKKYCFFDTKAYKRFVAMDVVLSGLALSESALKNKDKINFKFLKYGSGFFAGRFERVIRTNILAGVVDGIEILFEQFGDKVLERIGHLEFTFYEQDSESVSRLEKLKKTFGIDYSFTMNDALMPLPLKSSKERLVMGVTNCGDTMVVFGNEMNFGSVDASIAENLESKGNIFSTILNPSMQEKFLNLDYVPQSCKATTNNANRL